MQFISCSFHLSEQQHLWRSEMAKPVRWRREMNRELHFHWWKEDNDDGDGFRANARYLALKQMTDDIGDDIDVVESDFEVVRRNTFQPVGGD